MLKREPIKIAVNQERWLVSYADFITLLFAFFVVMYSVSSVNEKKYQAVFNQFQSAFPKLDQTDGLPSQVLTSDNIDVLINDVQVLISQLNTDFMGLTDNEEWVDITLDSHMLFDSASAELTNQARLVLKDVGLVLTTLSNRIQVRGHTDDIPISNTLFKNNWALSTARAVAVVSFLTDKGVEPAQLTAMGFSQYEPIDSNETEFGRKNNRRVVIRVLKNTPRSNNDSVDIISDTDEKSTDDTNNDKQTLDENLNHQKSNYDKSKAIIKPLKLDNGGLLFTSQPE